MTTVYNEIIINASIEKIWKALSDIDNLDKFDPTVKKVSLLTSTNFGVGSQRKVDMKDGKNWFNETCTVYKPNESLLFELSACSFPVQNLKHEYRFEPLGNQIKVKQKMVYQMKFGVIGKLFDFIMVKKQTNTGIKLFFQGLKEYAETK